MRGRVADCRQEIARRFAAGESSNSLVAAMTVGVEEIVRRLHESALAELLPAHAADVAAELALVALGGFGRADLAPYSDIDVLFLLAPNANEATLAYAKRLVRAIWDVGLSLGQKVATAREIVASASAETMTATSLLETRFLLGNQRLADELQRLLTRHWRRHGKTLMRKAIAAIADEHAKFGETVHLLEPNVKRSVGGLRDLHLIRWLGRLVLGGSTPFTFQELEDRQILVAGDAASLAEAREFLLRVRIDLHLHSARENDALVREEQYRIAQTWRYENTNSLLAVEQFMRDYFRLTTNVADILEGTIERIRPRELLGDARHALLSRRAGEGLSIGPEELVVAEAMRANVASSLERTLEVAELAATHQVELDRRTIEALRAVYGRTRSNGHQNRLEIPMPMQERPSIEAVRRFRAMLGCAGTLHRIFRRLHQVGVLERLIPEFAHARGLLQFNAYHKYTVDEHTFVMLQRAEEMLANHGIPGRAYRKVVRKDLLHLAILLHDLGKGCPEDHSEVGRRIAEATAQRLGYNEEERQTLVFLVHRHLALSHLAFHRDSSDERLLVQMSRELGSVQRLHQLYVLTVADIMAVGPGVYNQWKADLLADLYRAILRLFGEEEHNDDRAAAAEITRQNLLAQQNNPETATFINSLPLEYLRDTPRDEIARLLAWWRMMDTEPVHVHAVYAPGTHTSTYTILTHEHLTEGIFHKLCGALSAHHLEILDARIRTLANGVVLDQFDVVDVHHAGPPTPDRGKQISTTIQRVIMGELLVSDILWSTRSSVFAPKRKLLAPDRHQVVVDNDSSSDYTVIDVFATNRRGLLYTVAKGIHLLGLSVQLARVGTYGDEAVDVFYVKEADGRKVHHPERIRLIHDHLISDLNRLATDPRSMGF